MFINIIQREWQIDSAVPVFFYALNIGFFFRLEILHPFFDITLYVNRYLTSFDKIKKKKWEREMGCKM